ncbi:MAG: hypothetical protein FWG94_09265 [Oscillospiraceae bacterium]|nr:hypothetical protein [Oscillospiraceae bacterium]
MSNLGSLLGSSDSSPVAYIIAFFLGIAAAIFAYHCFSKTRLRIRFVRNPSLLLLHDFLNFKKMWSLWFYKIFYLAFACILTLFSIVALFDINFFFGLIILVFGNIALRSAYEFVVLFFSMHENLVAITDKMTNRTPENGSDVSIGQFFGEMGSQLKNQSDKMRARAEENRVRAQTEQRMYEQQYDQQYGQQGHPPQGYPQQTSQPYAPPPHPAAPQAEPPSAAPTAFCAKCGTPVDGGAFCAKCGTPVS